MVFCVCVGFFFSFSLKALFLFGFKCLPKWFKSTHSNAIFCCYHYLFAGRSDKNGFRRIMTVKFQFWKKYPTKKRWLKWNQLTAVIIDNFINSWQNWFPQKILITADIDRRASCFLSICVFFLTLVEIRLINECGWRHTHTKNERKKAKTPNICIYKRGSNQSQCPNWPILKHIPLNSGSAKEMNDGQNNGILTNFNRLLNGFTSLIGISGFY